MKCTYSKLLLTFLFICQSAAYSQALIWNERQPAGVANYNWGTASMSPDGMKIIAGVFGGRLYLSTNGGRSWSETQPVGNVSVEWNSSAISSDGTKIIVGMDPGRLYISTNGGSNWAETQPRGAGDYSWTTISMSSDGARIIAGYQSTISPNLGRIYISTNYGSSWTETQPAGNNLELWRTTSMSSDGTKIIAGYGGSGKIYLSTDGGGSWTETTPGGAATTGSWAASSISSDGTKIIAAAYGSGGRVYISTNSGASWNETQPFGYNHGYWRSVSISSDGTKLFAGVDQGDFNTSRLYFSTNSGANWSETQPAGNINGKWLAVPISSDGSKAFAINNGGRVYYSTTYPGAGSGTSGDPFQVSSLACLSYICQNPGAWDKYFIQTANIDASQTQYWDDADDNLDGNIYNDPNDLTSAGNNEGWSPIGNSTTKFTGNYDGGGYTISNVTINRGSTSRIGLFGYTSGGTISNLSLTAVSVTGGAYSGGFVGVNSGTTMTKCSSTGTVSGTGYIGGFAGGMEVLPTVDQCYSTVSVTSTSVNCGGFAGSVTNATISNSYATGSVTGGTSYRGGFVGNAATSTIDKCYSTGLVSVSSSVGGFIGINDNAGRLTVTNSFWDNQTSGQVSSDGGTGKTTVQMKTTSTFTNTATSAGLTEAWDFTTPLWQILGTNYPNLKGNATVVNAQIFLQGPFNAGTMTTTLNSGGLLPLTSETGYPAATYGYTARTVGSIPNATIVDWVLVELRTGTAANTKVAEVAAFVKNDGTIVDIDGTSLLTVPVNAGSYYIVVRHRNHLAIMSASAVPLTGTSALYNFTTAQAQAYGSSAMAALAGGVFGLFSGDSNRDGQITALDFNTWNSNTKAGQTGYVADDMNLDAQVTALDFNQWNANTKLGAATKMP